MTIEARRSPGETSRNLIDRARRAGVLHRVAFEGTDPHSVRVPEGAVDELVQSLSNMVNACVAQIVPFAPQGRSSSAFSRRLWRNMAQSIPIERYYLVPSGEENRRQAQLQVDEDEAHHLHSVHLPVVADWSSVRPVPMTTLWLIDNEVVVRQEQGGPDTGSWLVTSRPSEVTRALGLIEALRTRVGTTRPTSRPFGPDITQWLLESAKKMADAAQLCCNGSAYIDSENCEWYHGSWQYLRALDMVSSPTWHADFYAEKLRSAIHEHGARRILISGAADWTTLSFVLDAARMPSGELVDGLAVQVVDLCATPLMACNWFARRWGVPRGIVTTHQADVTHEGDLRQRGVSADEPFDVIVADAFLTRFEPPRVHKVLRNWYKLLSPDGIVVTTVRMHSSNRYPDPESFDTESRDSYRVTNPVDDFELRLRERAAIWQDMLSIDLEDLARRGRQYAKRIVSHDLGGIDHIVATLKDHGFREIHHGTARVQGELVSTKYVRIAARRPDSPVPVKATTQD